MQKITFAVADPRLVSPNFAFCDVYDESKSHSISITYITFQGSRNATNTIIEFLGFQ